MDRYEIQTDALERLWMNKPGKHLQAIHDPGTGAGYEITFCHVDPTILASICQIQAALRFGPEKMLVFPTPHTRAGYDHFGISHGYGFWIYLSISRQIVEDIHTIHTPSLAELIDLRFWAYLGASPSRSILN